MTYERDAYMRRQEEDHDMIRMRQPRRVYNSEGCADAMCADADAMLKAAEARVHEHRQRLAEIERHGERKTKRRRF